MPKFSITRARNFLKRSLKAPLFEHMGQPLDDDSVVQAKTIKQLEKAVLSNDRFWSNMANHRTGMLATANGWDWFQKHNNDSVGAVQEEIDKLDFKARIDDAWASADIPEIIGSYTSTKQWMNNHFRMTAFAYALNFDETQSFYRCFIEPWLLQGRFPCGWKGKPLPEPKSKYSVSPWEKVTVKDLVGDGRLIVY